MLTLELKMPALCVTDTHARAAMAAEVERLETEARKNVRSRGWQFIGAAKIKKLSPYDRATSWEPLRGRNPTFAVGRGQREAFFHAVAGLRAFRNAYRTALDDWRRGVRNLLFPAGTWLMSWLHAAHVAPA